ncbi:type VI secretion system contractile sheath domain-containing protein [Enterobacter hormaechei]|uniref:type VI secretion system contractile sheath domain-containing protein n=3 Tax=Enterobacter hormaechei TaxID=158836 RepID=UPI00287775D3|nr:type VI secretion system contractile sheath large subunit [Enterobacter hormaechei]MDV2199103.1 type VI secretion system contractile sheath large subunit [Enterobacter hormaechei]
MEKLDKTLIDHHIAELDFQISRQLDAVMHHQEFQKVESLWRGLKQLVDTAHQLITTLSAILLKYEPRLSRINVVMQEQIQPGELRYAIDAELKGVGLVRYGTEFMPEGRVLIRHLKQQQYLDARAAI